MTKHEGTVDYWNDTGGYGFIETDATDDDVFFHSEDTSLTEFSEGTPVEFRIVQSDKGPRAEDLSRAQSTASGGTASGNATEYEGTVDFFNDTGGYGFIEAPAIDDEVFFHMEDIDGPDLTEGTDVTFEVEYAEKGPRTLNVRRGHSAVSSSQPSETTTTSTAPADQTGDTQVYDAGSTNDETSVYDPGGATAAGEPTGTTDDSTDASPRFCPYCGTDLSAYPDGAFCPDCGTEL